MTEGRTIRWARGYDLGVEAMYFGRGDRYRRRLLDLAEVKAGDRVLDVGCGPGRLVLAACERAGQSGEADGIDPSAQMVALATRKALKAGLSALFVQAAAEKLPFDDGYFDAVTSSLVVHHIPGGRPQAQSVRRDAARSQGRRAAAGRGFHGASVRATAPVRETARRAHACHYDRRLPGIDGERRVSSGRYGRNRVQCIPLRAGQCGRALTRK